MSDKSPRPTAKQCSEEELLRARAASRRDFVKGVAAAGLVLPMSACRADGGGGSSTTSTGTGQGSGSSGDGGDGGDGTGQTDSSGTGPGTTGEGTGGTQTTAPGTDSTSSTADGKSRVYVIATEDRMTGMADLLAMAGLGFASGRSVVLKPNFNSANAFPASTHDDTIRAVVQGLRDAGAGSMRLAESSGPSGTANVIAQKGTLALCDELGIEFVNIDELPDTEWETFDFGGMTWPDGLAIPRMFRGPDAVVLMPCCKTHAYGGHFTLSLKLAVGLTPRSRRNEMHNAPTIRSWIADINYGFDADLVVMDALSAFITGGPDSGTLAEPGLLLASSDRIAMDAVAVAVLHRAGADLLQSSAIFEHEQIARAVQLGLGATSSDEIELLGNDQTVIDELRGILDMG
jgi:uncharacterized protein (DUF362 family)